MQDERFGLRFAALMFVAVAAFLAMMTLITYWQSSQIAQLVIQSDATPLDWSQLWLVPVLLGGGTIVVLAVAVGFWRAASNAGSVQPYMSSYQTPQPSVSYQQIPQQSGGSGLDPNVLQEIKVHLVNDRVIQAVKLYRQTTGVGLKEARDAVLVIKAGM